MVAVVGQDAEIMDALYTHALLMATTGPTLPVSVPNAATTFDAPTDSPYLRARVLPNRPRAEGLHSGKLPQGMLMIDVVTPKGFGEIAAANIVGQVKAHFAKLTRLTSGATTVMIDKQPWAGPDIAGAAEVFIPVTIYWIVTP